MKSQGRAFNAKEVIPWALQLADILKYLHSHKPYPIIFRDLKPSNVMLTPKGKIKLIDFGIARYFKPGKTRDTFPMGTPGFSAPEQYGFGQSDPRSDIFSFGATLYYLLTGEDTMRYNLRIPHLRTHSRFPVPQWLQKIVIRCLSANPGERFQTAQELREALEEGVEISAKSRRISVPISVMEIMVIFSILTILAV